MEQLEFDCRLESERERLLRMKCSGARFGCRSILLHPKEFDKWGSIKNGGPADADIFD